MMSLEFWKSTTKRSNTWVCIARSKEDWKLKKEWKLSPCSLLSNFWDSTTWHMLLTLGISSSHSFALQVYLMHSLGLSSTPKLEKFGIFLDFKSITKKKCSRKWWKKKESISKSTTISRQALKRLNKDLMKWVLIEYFLDIIL